VLGFAFDALAAEVTEADGVTVETSRAGFAEVAQERKFGRIKMLLVRMNVDLLMGDELKKTGAGNLFTVFGEPDLEIRRTDSGEVVVELHGVDVYDPTTGEVRSRDTDRIALWMIDTDYNGDSFFVRHCYFTGGGDPYKRLKTALKAEVDADAWASLYGTVSRPFPAPSTGKIAVKVINDYGDEVMKIFDGARACVFGRRITPWKRDRNGGWGSSAGERFSGGVGRGATESQSGGQDHRQRGELHRGGSPGVVGGVIASKQRPGEGAWSGEVAGGWDSAEVDRGGSGGDRARAEGWVGVEAYRGGDRSGRVGHLA
jgi:hypothetical protein